MSEGLEDGGREEDIHNAGKTARPGSKGLGYAQVAGN